jgi:cysteinyl-tRNA synthetase
MCEPAASGAALRFALLNRPRRIPVTLDATALAEAADALDRSRKAVAAWAKRPSKPVPEHIRQALRAAWEDDLDVLAVLGVLREVEEARDVSDGARFETYAYADRLLGLELTREIGASS